MEAFSGIDAAKSVCLRMFSLAKTRILHHSGQYLFGVYLWTGFGDPDFALVVWEAISHVENHKDKPKKRTKEGKRLEKFMNDSPIQNEFHRNKFAALTRPIALDQMSLALRQLRNGRKELFVQSVLNADEGNILWELRLWLPVLSNTRVVERCFLHDDNLALDAGSGTKTAASKVEERVLKERERVRAKDDLCTMAQNAFHFFVPSEEELKRARDTTNAVDLELPEPRKEESIISQKQVRELEEKAESLSLPSKSLAMLLKDGLNVVVGLTFLCFSDDECVKREAKGKKEDMVKCAHCEHIYHQKCLENSALVEKGVENENLELVCAMCSPTGEIKVRLVGQKKKKKKK